MMNASAIIEIRGVYKSFGANEVLKDIALSVSAGKTFAVIGESGSGKSTLVRCINNLEPIDRGTIQVGRTTILPDRVEEAGRRLTAREVARFRTRIGMVF